jgi:hypothetical protein
MGTPLCALCPLWCPSCLLLLLLVIIPCLVTMTAINETARRVLLDCDTPLKEQLEGKAPTTWQKWNHRSKCKKEAAHHASSPPAATGARWARSASRASSAHLPPPTTKDKGAGVVKGSHRRVFIWQGERSHSRVSLKFMYKPAVGYDKKTCTSYKVVTSALIALLFLRPFRVFFHP